MKAKMGNSGCDVIRGIIVIVLVLLVGLVSAYTPEQQTTIDGMNLSYQLGIAYEKASQGQNVAEFNVLVDTYNAWIRQHFGEDANLLKTKINYTPPVAVPPASDTTETNATSPVAVSSETESRGKYIAPTSIYEFEPDSELSQFGKKTITRRA